MFTVWSTKYAGCTGEIEYLHLPNWSAFTVTSTTGAIGWHTKLWKQHIKGTTVIYMIWSLILYNIMIPLMTGFWAHRIVVHSRPIGIFHPKDFIYNILLCCELRNQPHDYNCVRSCDKGKTPPKTSALRGPVYVRRTFPVHLSEYWLKQKARLRLIRINASTLWYWNPLGYTFWANKANSDQLVLGKLHRGLNVGHLGFVYF